MRGGANGARIRLAPQSGWDVNIQAGVADVVSTLEQIQADFNAQGGSQVSLADLIVLGGYAAVEKAASDGGHDIAVSFSPGRTDALQGQTDVESFSVLEPPPTASATTWPTSTSGPPRNYWWTRPSCSA